MAAQTRLTPYAGVILSYDDRQHPTFPIEANGALDAIYNGGPVGRRLLDDMASIGPTFSPPNGAAYCVKISPADNNRTIRVSEDNARWLYRPGASVRRGSASVIGYDYRGAETPDGERPPFIGLAHELIHARRNLLGTANPHGDWEEKETVGFALYSGDAGITENAIRQEHGLPRRVTYDKGDTEPALIDEMGVLLQS